MAFHEECAVFGAWNDPEAAQMTYLGLYALQHRGQESTGIVSLDDGKHRKHKGVGLVGDVFQESDLERLTGRAAIGHNRYSTRGGKDLNNSQPLTVELASGPVAIAHNGQISNAADIRKQLIAEGAIFQGSNDTEVILHMLARRPETDAQAALMKILPQLEGAFSLVMMTGKELIAARDAKAFRPLVLGYRDLPGDNRSVVVASETCAFDLIGAKFEREVQPGEIFCVSAEGERTSTFKEADPTLSQCVFEHVYFSRPDSIVFGQGVYEARKKMGQELAKENPVNADIVIPVPDSGVPAAMGYSQASGLPFEMGIIRNHYIGRTFIQPSPSIRSFGVKIKLNPQSDILKGKRVVVIDDSIVRGTTSQKIIRLIRQAGAKEVHFKIASPPTIGPCYYGVDTPRRKHLIAASHTVEEISRFIGADTLSYLSKEGMLKAIRGSDRGYCAACFDGKYPTAIPVADSEDSL